MTPSDFSDREKTMLAAIVVAYMNPIIKTSASMTDEEYDWTLKCTLHTAATIVFGENTQERMKEYTAYIMEASGFLTKLADVSLSNKINTELDLILEKNKG